MDFTKLTQKLLTYFEEEAKNTEELSSKLLILRREYQKFLDKPKAEIEKLPVSLKKPIAIPVSREIMKAGEPKSGYLVFGCDGSETVISHHEGLALSLVSFGGIKVDYGQDKAEIISDFSILPPGSEVSLGVERAFFELKTAEFNLDATAADTYLIMDGSIVPWWLLRLEKEQVVKLLPEWQEITARITSKALFLGYISNSNASEVLSSVIKSAGLDAESYKGITDSLLFSSLPAGFFSPVFKLKFGGELFQEIYVTYLNTGDEIVRIEWLGRKPDLSIIISQVRLGQGYPIVLSEAHNAAVIRGSDREAIKVIASQIKGGVLKPSQKGRSKLKAANRS